MPESEALRGGFKKGFLKGRGIQAQKDAREAFEALNEAHRMMRDPGLYVRPHIPCLRTSVLDATAASSKVASISVSDQNWYFKQPLGLLCWDSSSQECSACA